jgi:hypothetical protein
MKLQAFAGFAVAAAIALSTGACGVAAGVAVIAAPAVDIAQAEMGQQQSYVDDGFDFLCTEVFGGTLPRDPKTGDCK